MRNIVGVAEMALSDRAGDEIITFALGSCIGITLHDPVAHVGGMVHVMLPNSSIDPLRALETPCMYIDTGVARLFLESYKLGACKSRLEVRAAGGACTCGSEEDDYFQIGRRNIAMLRTLLAKNGVFLQGSDLGGKAVRTMSLHIGTGIVTVRSNGIVKTLTADNRGGAA